MRELISISPPVESPGPKKAFRVFGSQQGFLRQRVIELVSYSPHGENVFGFLGILFDLRTEAIDVGVDVSLVTLVCGIPDRVE